MLGLARLQKFLSLNFHTFDIHILAIFGLILKIPKLRKGNNGQPKILAYWMFYNHHFDAFFGPFQPWIRISSYSLIKFKLNLRILANVSLTFLAPFWESKGQNGWLWPPWTFLDTKSSIVAIFDGISDHFRHPQSSYLILRAKILKFKNIHETEKQY